MTDFQKFMAKFRAIQRLKRWKRYLMTSSGNQNIVRYNVAQIQKNTINFQQFVSHLDKVNF
jgi:hypothetical protein